MDDGILWRRIQRKKVIADTHGDIMTGHESTNKTKERIISSYWWPGMDIHIKSVTNTKEQERKKRQHYLCKSFAPML